MEYKANQVPMIPDTYPYPYPGPGQGEQQVQSTVITVAPSVPPVQDHFLWSIFNFSYLNFCCLGFIALIYSVKSRDRKYLGDLEGARNYASSARTLNIVTTVLSILLIVILIAVLSESVFHVANTQQQHPKYYYS
ncbi:dispanin subfamily A member 2b-like [Mustelus asterias]